MTRLSIAGTMRQPLSTQAQPVRFSEGSATQQLSLAVSDIDSVPPSLLESPKEPSSEPKMLQMSLMDPCSAASLVVHPRLADSRGQRGIFYFLSHTHTGVPHVLSPGRAPHKSSSLSAIPSSSITINFVSPSESMLPSPSVSTLGKCSRRVGRNLFWYSSLPCSS